MENVLKGGIDDSAETTRPSHVDRSIDEAPRTPCVYA